MSTPLTAILPRPGHLLEHAEPGKDEDEHDDHGHDDEKDLDRRRVAMAAKVAATPGAVLGGDGHDLLTVRTEFGVTSRHLALDLQTG